jgi:hypothetical protein
MSFQPSLLGERRLSDIATLLCRSEHSRMIGVELDRHELHEATRGADTDDACATAEHLELLHSELNVVDRDGLSLLATQLDDIGGEVGDFHESAVGGARAEARLDDLHTELIVKITNTEQLGPKALIDASGSTPMFTHMVWKCLRKSGFLLIALRCLIANSSKLR